MLKKVFLLLLGGGLMIHSLAQDITYENLSYEFSQRDIFGTARVQAMGGSNVSLGANPASIIQNPAGLGLYKSNDLSLSLGIQAGNAESSYSIMNNSLGPALDEGYSRFNVPNIGLVIKIPEDKVQLSGWSKGAISFGLNRTAHFNSETRYGGNNSANNKRDFYVEAANGLDYFLPGYEEFDAADNAYVGDELDMAYYTYLINDVYDEQRNANGEYYFSIDANEPAYQQGIIKRRGGIDELDIGYGTSYDDKFFMGLSIGLAFLKQSINSTYSEYVEGSTLIDYTYNQTLETSGSGANIKLGLIWHVIPALRLGFSYETPTWFRLEESLSSDMTANYYNGSSVQLNDTTTYVFDGYPYPAETVINNFKYNLTTPSRLKVGGTYFFEQTALLTADAEMVFYDGMNLNPRDGQLGNYFDYENGVIESIYKPALNLRIGGELRLDHVYLRAGAAYFQDPMKEEYQLVDRSKMNVTGGIGYRDSDWYLDFGVVQTSYKNAFKPYELSDGNGPLATTTHNDWRFVVTTGWTFD